MQPGLNRRSTSDDEEDLESLRLAALQSLKRTNFPVQNLQKPMYKTFTGPKKALKRIRGFHGGGRLNRNDPYNRRGNTNLIAVPTIESEQDKDVDIHFISKKKFTDDTVSKLVLPQDRYCKIQSNLESSVSNEVSSKFDRYNDSDKSDSELDSDQEHSSEKLERSNSLEALMQELENEIQGEVKQEQPLTDNVEKPKKIKKPRKSKPEVPSTNFVVVNEKQDNIINVANDKPKRSPIRHISKSPIRDGSEPQFINCVSQEGIINSSVHPLPYINSNIAMTVPDVQFHQVPYANFNAPVSSVPVFDPTIYNYTTPPPLGDILNNISSSHVYSSNQYDRSVSPLTINTDVLNTIAAPLSPRSAAFVLQNREIVERRKKSPKRLYSRSPSPDSRSTSPRYRRSNSRSHSPSPIMRVGRRLSPNRQIPSTSRKLSPSARRISPSYQPFSNSNSPYTNRYRLSSPKRLSPKRSHRSPQQSHLRNVQKPNKLEKHACNNVKRDREIRKRRSISISLSPSPERFTVHSPPNQEERVDPILEARKRKFEENVTPPTEGIICLKPKSNDETSSSSKDYCTEDLSDDKLLTGDDAYLECNIKVDDLFSDEESDNENEGRFKSNTSETTKDGKAIPFTQLVDGLSNFSKNKKMVGSSEEKVKTKRHSKSYRDKDNQKNRRGDILTKASPVRAQTGAKCIKIDDTTKVPKIRKLVKVDKKVEKHNVKSSSLDIVSKVRCKRPIKIKIRNPSKYEISSSSHAEHKNDKNCTSRKVEVDNSLIHHIETNEDFLLESDPEILIDAETNKDVINNAKKDAGDLRVQLSKKRAERRSKLPKTDEVSSRLLQTALQGAVFKKAKKSKKKSKETAPLDVDTNIYAASKRTANKTGYGFPDISYSAASKERKVQLLYCDAEPLSATADCKLPIHLRLGVPGTTDSIILRKGTFSQV